ncbi:hypothetical protein Celal_1669 [Cellulophaga algicola DSM 14237]|uniref:Uncharacterized protein n=1 Tax=Cellulophaga algicola (strain DSM 14237 / IC166 / ACAM 630) TaxID=688270 RepID=E6XBX5_CELAD|nr:hypothetical protein Celal_1669 [Cellulophaga algicola DSM 14237]
MSKKTKNNITDILISILIIMISSLIIMKSVEAFNKRDPGPGFLLMLASIFLNIAFSFCFINKKSIKYFIVATFCFYNFYFFWAIRKEISFNTGSILLILIFEFSLILIYGIYYLIRKKKLMANSSNE